MLKKEGELTFADSPGITKVKIDREVADNEYVRQLGRVADPDIHNPFKFYYS